MSRWIVSAPSGEYHVTAPSADDAKRAVYMLTFGLVAVADMTAKREVLSVRILNAGQRPGMVSCASSDPAGGARHSAFDKQKEQAS